MDETPDCARVRPLLAELATGAATGQERAHALRHAAGCAGCGRQLADLARVVDALLLLTPEREPPAGFETAVAQRIAAYSHGRPRRRAARIPAVVRGFVPSRRAAVRLAAAFAAVVFAFAGGATVAYRQGADDRAAADTYRRAQAAGAGQYPKAAEVTTASGDVVGRVYLYQGSPSWVMVALFAAPEPGQYAMTVQTADGTSYSAGTCVVTGRSATVGYPLPVAANLISAIDITRPGVRLSVDPNK